MTVVKRGKSSDVALRLTAEAAIARAVVGHVPNCTYEMLTSRLMSPPYARGYIKFGENSVPYRDLNSKIRSVEDNLRQSGITELSHVAIVDTNSVDWVCVFLALMRIGAIAVPINTRLTTVEMAWQIRRADCTHVILRQAYRRRSLDELTTELMGPGGPSIISIAGAVNHDAGRPRNTQLLSNNFGPDRPAVILFTSGSTASPKGCVLTQAGMIANAAQHTQRLGIDFRDVWFSAMPLFHGGGLIWGLSSALVSGCSLVGPEVFDAGQSLELIEAHGATYQHGIDTMFLRELEHPDFRPERLRTLRAAASTGSPETLKLLHDEMGIEGIVSKWGITEGYGNLTSCHPGDPLNKRLSTVGYGYAGIEYRIVAPGTDDVLSVGQTGEVITRGRRMIGYYEDSRATSDLIDEQGWLHSGDAGAFDDDGYLHYEGRIKEMLKVGGENVSIAEVESVVLEHADVIVACVVSVPDGHLHEVPVVAVVTRNEAADREGSILDYCRSRLADFKVPRSVIEMKLDEMPLTGSGKVSRMEVRALVLARLEKARN